MVDSILTKEHIMDYRYSNELDVTARIDVTLGDLDTLLDMLEPIATDNDHDHRYRATDMARKLKDIRTRLIKQTHGYLQARADALK
jgi:hypothetical protein